MVSLSKSVNGNGAGGTANGNTINRLTLMGLIVTLGIVYGDLGTSPLYVMHAIVSLGSKSNAINFDFIAGALSCIFWTMTMQTTIKYVIITLRADNKGEGGILALYALLKKKKKKSLVYIVAIVGASALVADGIITPSITVVSAVEGVNTFTSGLPVRGIAIAILAAIFFMQQFGTQVIGRMYGPLMFVWFVMLGTLGIVQVVQYPHIITALNPAYAIRFITTSHYGLLLMGAVFLCTTGAEALYSDLGHCGLRNIRISWIFVKTMLLLNYMGQGAWILSTNNITDSSFFGLMPHWMIVPGVVISALAASVASQALISGSFTIFNEAMSLNFWPRQRIRHTSNIRGHIYVPFINWFLFAACIFVIFIFRDSDHMTPAYGLAISITMLMTSVLLLYYMRSIKTPTIVQVVFATVFFSIEGMFFVANVSKFMDGAAFTLFFAVVFSIIMYVWYNGRKIKNKYIRFYKLRDFHKLIVDIKNDASIPKYATNLVYLSKADLVTDVESKIIFSIINKDPKRADHYWLIHTHYVDEPNTHQYSFEEIIPGTLYRVEFLIGFRVGAQLYLDFKKVVQELIDSGEIDGRSGYASLQKHKVRGDFRYIVIHRVQNYEQGFSFHDKVIMGIYNLVARIGVSDIRAFGLDTSNVTTELVPLIVDQKHKTRLKRVAPAGVGRGIGSSSSGSAASGSGVASGSGSSGSSGVDSPVRRRKK
ncbi:MAG: KUP/HAK/KT family potassium transporter [Rikenellaceae bacterium]|jgi:KUP system potassium uptake protein|nr:KUP/HAK/KT family potassium transporter [Rikenellaceae bacterium]